MVMLFKNHYSDAIDNSLGIPTLFMPCPPSNTLLGMLYLCMVTARAGMALPLLLWQF